MKRLVCFFFGHLWMDKFWFDEWLYCEYSRRRCGLEVGKGGV